MILCASPGEQTRAHREEIDRAIAAVLDTGWYVLGEQVRTFEREFAAHCGVKHAIGVGSGTEALHIALRALGIGAGDEVIAVAHTAVATVAAIEMAGAVPVLVDIDPRTFTIDPRQVEKAITPRTRAVIAVHLYGQPADLDALLELRARHGFKLIEDCAQSTGGLHGAKRLGSLGDVGCFSFYPTKNLGAIGDGGAIVTDDPATAHQADLLRQYGWEERYVSKIPGVNSRLDELQAAILRVKLPHLDADNERRRQIATAYDAALRGGPVTVPGVRIAGEHVYHLYVVRSARRDALQAFLKTRGVHTMVHYPVPVHRQPAYRDRVRTMGTLPETDLAAREILSLPMYAELPDAAIQAVIDAVRAFAG